MMAQNDEKLRKLFVGGLSATTTDDTLKAYFEQWGGTLTDHIVMKDRNTGRSRGFGFVTFQAIEELDVAMSNRPHVIDEKPVETKRAAPRELSSDPSWQQTCSKIFVGGYKDDISEDDLKNYFGQFGVVEVVDIIGSKPDGKKKGFCFVTFTDYDPVDKVCLQRYHHINGHKLETKKALSREQMAQLNSKQQMGGPPNFPGHHGGGYGGPAYHGGGRGRGGYHPPPPPHYGGGYGGEGAGGYGGGYGYEADPYAGGYGGGPPQGYSGGYGGGASGGGGYGGGRGGYGGAPPRGGGPMRYSNGSEHRPGPYYGGAAAGVGRGAGAR